MCACACVGACACVYVHVCVYVSVHVCVYVCAAHACPACARVPRGGGRHSSNQPCMRPLPQPNVCLTSSAACRRSASQRPPHLGEVGRQRRVHEHQAEQLAHVLRDGQRGDAVKHTQRVALVQQLLQGGVRGWGVWGWEGGGGSPEAMRLCRRPANSTRPGAGATLHAAWVQASGIVGAGGGVCPCPCRWHERRANCGGGFHLRVCRRQAQSLRLAGPPPIVLKAATSHENHHGVLLGPQKESQTCTSRSCSVPVTMSTTLSIMCPYVQ